MGAFDMGEGKAGSGFGGGLSDLRKDNGDREIAQQEQEIAELARNQQRREQRQRSMQLRARAAAQHAQEIKKRLKQVEEIKKIRRASWFIRLLPLCGGLCIPALIIFACVAVLAIAWGVYNETVLGQIIGEILSWFSSDVDEIVDEMQFE